MNDEISQLRAEIADLKRHVLELKHLVALGNMARRPVLRPADEHEWLAALARRRSAEADQQDAYTPALDAWKE
ncbi:hypothetical protein [Xanthobacter sp. VNH20]|uniref:hypothetical protein n=1 Tax=Xanthobacter sp. VNH20 TaxID=3156616 RepID=UPI0032B49960